MRTKDAPSALTTSKLLVRSRSCSDTIQLVSEGLRRGTQRHIHSGPRALHSRPGTAQAGRAEARFGADAFPHAAGLQVRGVFCSFSKASSDFIVRRQHWRTHKIHARPLFVSPVRLLLNSRLLQLSFWGIRVTEIWGCATGSAPPSP